MLNDPNLTFRIDEDTLIIQGCFRDNVIFSLKCVNRLHFYTVCFVIRKMEEGEKVDEFFFQVLK